MFHKTLIINILLIAFLFSSCKKEQEKMPIEIDKLENILTDIHVAEAAMQYIAEEAKDSLGEVYYNQIFEIHGITRENFIECMKILETNPREASIIYQNLMDGLEGRKNKATSKKPKKMREWSRDSLSRE